MEEAKENEKAEAHVLIFPYPLQGHITSMLRLAEALSFAGGIHVSFLITDHNHRLLSRSSPIQYSRFSLRPRFRFLSVPDGLPSDHPRSVHHLLELEHSLRTSTADSFRDLLLTGRCREADGWPPVTFVIVDGICVFAMDVAQELGIPAFVFRTISASCLWIFLCIPQMIEAGEIPFPDNADLDELVKSVPSMEGFLRRRDLPIISLKTVDNAKHIRLAADISAASLQANGLIINTLSSLEGPVLSHIRTRKPSTYTVGPIHALAQSFTSFPVSASLLTEDHSSLSWLDDQPDCSVVYASFGSLAQLTEAEFTEFWHGFVNSGHRFLWVVRPGLVDGRDASADMIESNSRVRFATWVPQEEVLRHRAVGCFFTHSGWNSTLESAAAGVPMVCWPQIWDQFINGRLVEDVWKVGLDMKEACRREVVEGMIRTVMEGEKAEELRKTAAEMAGDVWKGVGDGGNSRLEFQRLVSDIKKLSISGFNDKE